jgi:tetratricopeptide (TPR) repeat protein
MKHQRERKREEALKPVLLSLSSDGGPGDRARTAVYGRGRAALAALALVALTSFVYRGLGSAPFIGLDDQLYVVGNPAVREGLTLGGAAWAFTATYAANWHPLTWLSHMADVTLFGLDAGWHHRVNVLVHCASAVLLFFALRKLTGALWRSLLVAALFAVHPLHVESVAWVSERKDTLSGLFWMLALLAYARHAERRTPLTALAVAACFALGLLAKPMVITLPFVLLLLDAWPLRGPASADRRRRLVEKLPLFALCAASAIVTFWAQRSGGAVGSLAAVPLDARLGNALHAYAAYLLKLAWPSSLAVFYPLPDSRPLPLLIGAAALLAAVSAAVIRAWPRFPYLAVGWLWYLGTLVPVIGIVQVGSQAMADRYTYLPSVGIFIMACWGVTDLLAGARRRAVLSAGIAVVAVCGFALAAAQQAGVWRSGKGLFEQALRNTSGNWMAHANLGVVLDAEGLAGEANSHYRAAIAIRPGYEVALNNLGANLNDAGSFAEAERHLSRAAAMAPASAEIAYNLGNALAGLGRLEEAIAAYEQTLRLRPGHLKARVNLGGTLFRLGHFREAADTYREALRLSPGDGQLARDLEMAATMQRYVEGATPPPRD